MKKLQSIRNLCQHWTKGQSLVETAIIAPIVIFMLIGLFEVGWALRGYLVLANVNREATRFAVRPGYMNFNDWPPAGLTAEQRKEWVGDHVGYNSVIAQMLNSMSSQLATTGEAITPGLVISHLAIDTGYPCDPEEIDKTTKKQKTAGTTMKTCDCNQFKDPNNLGFTKDDKIFHPGLSAYKEFYAFTYDPNPTDAITYTTTYSYATLAKQLAAENNLINCQLLKRTTSATPKANYLVMTEIFYRQPQLFGFPLISNPFTDPVPMFGHTMMRIPPARSGNDRESCEVYPFVIRDTTISYPNFNSPPVGTVVDIFDGHGPSDFGWLGWNGVPTTDLDAVYLGEELQHPEMSMSDFYDAHQNEDRVISVGDWVASLEGDRATVNAPGGPELVSALIKVGPIRIPVWDQFQAGGAPCGPGCKAPGAYHIAGFVWVQIESVGNIDLPGKVVRARYLGDANKGCALDDYN